ncbi:MAG: hypothetical protein V1773_04510 [bacterium]
MVNGIENFKNHFKECKNQYILIGGTACDILHAANGLEFRSTKDLDMVLIIKAIDSAFSKVFWEFIKKGKYQNKQKMTGKKLYYRFYGPEEDNFPEMLELFSTAPNVLSEDSNIHLTKISIDDDVLSLSAILLEEEYYEFILNNKAVVNDFPIISAAGIIPLKAKAYIDLRTKKDNSKKIDEKDIVKHKNDIFRIYRLLAENSKIFLPDKLKADMNTFFEMIQNNPPDLYNLGIKRIPLETVLFNLKKIYNL